MLCILYIYIYMGKCQRFETSKYVENQIMMFHHEKWGWTWLNPCYPNIAKPCSFSLPSVTPALWEHVAIVKQGTNWTNWLRAAHWELENGSSRETDDRILEILEYAWWETSIWTKSDLAFARNTICPLDCETGKRVHESEILHVPAMAQPKSCCDSVGAKYAMPILWSRVILEVLFPLLLVSFPLCLSEAGMVQSCSDASMASTEFHWRYAKNARLEGPAAASLWFSSMILILRSCFTQLIHYTPFFSRDVCRCDLLESYLYGHTAIWCNGVETFGNGNSCSGIGSGSIPDIWRFDL